MKKLPKGEALRFGWEKVKSSLWFFAGVTLTALVVTVVPNILTQEGNPTDVQLIGSLLSLILQTILGVGTTRIALKYLRGEKAVFRDLFAFQPYFFKYLAASLLIFLLGIAIMGGAVFVGLILSAVLRLVGVNILGALALLVGLLVTLPMTFLAEAYIYQKLLDPTQAE